MITNAEMPYVERIDGNEDKEGVRKILIEKIRDIRKRIKNGESPDPKGAEHYKEYLNPEKIKARIYQLIK